MEVTVPGSSFSTLLDTTDGASGKGSIPAYKNMCSLHA
jgi:hypothetical protein